MTESYEVLRDNSHSAPWKVQIETTVLKIKENPKNWPGDVLFVWIFISLVIAIFVTKFFLKKA